MLHVFVVQDAYAAGGEFGILEGRIFSLIHPIVMISLFVATGYAGYLGWQWRRVRTIQDDINALKKQVPVAAEGQTAPSPLEAQIKELSEVCRIHIYSILLYSLLQSVMMVSSSVSQNYHHTKAHLLTLSHICHILSTRSKHKMPANIATFIFLNLLLCQVLFLQRLKNLINEL